MSEAVRRRHLGPTHQHRDYRDVALQSRSRLYANEVSRIVKATCSIFVCCVEPSRAHHHQQHAALRYAFFNRLSEVASCFNADDIHEHHAVRRSV